MEAEAATPKLLRDLAGVMANRWPRLCHICNTTLTKVSNMLLTLPQYKELTYLAGPYGQP